MNNNFFEVDITFFLKIRLQIEENKKRPKKVGGFSARLQKAMEQAERQRKIQKKSR